MVSINQIIFNDFTKYLFFLLVLKQMGQDFVTGFIHAMDGEKDPRNLLLAFSLVKLIIREFDISQHVEVCNLFNFLMLKF